MVSRKVKRTELKIKGKENSKYVYVGSCSFMDNVVLGQAFQSYPYNGDCMLGSKKNFVLSTNEKKTFNSNIKIGIYIELGAKSLLTDKQVSFLIEKEKKISN